MFVFFYSIDMYTHSNVVHAILMSSVTSMWSL